MSDVTMFGSPINKKVGDIETVIESSATKTHNVENTDKLGDETKKVLKDRDFREELAQFKETNFHNGIIAASNNVQQLHQKVYLDMDAMLTIIGEFGKFQKMVNAMYCIMTLPAIFNLVLVTFLVHDLSWQCIPGSVVCVWNGTFESSNQNRCSIPRSEWKYTEPRENSIVTYFDINCDREWLISLTFSIYFIGWGIGSSIVGWIGDNYGRKIVILGSISMLVIVGLCSIFAPNIYIFIACRFIVGFCTYGSFPSMVISITEIVGIKYRPFASLMICLFMSIGLAILCMKAYLIRQWKLLIIACTAPYSLVVLFYKFIPESIRFLVLKGRNEEAMRILHNIAKLNKKQIPEHVVIAPINLGKSKQSAGPLALVRSKTLVVQNLVLSFSWFAIGASDIGLFLAAYDFGGNMFREFIILCAVEIPVCLFAMKALETVGRKRTVTVSLFITSLSFSLLCAIPKTGNIKIARITTALIAKVFVVLALYSIYTWTVELYPTKLRGMGMGLCQVMKCIGGASSPWFAYELKNISNLAPYVTLAIATFISGCLLCLLPESKGEPLSEFKLKKRGNNQMTELANVAK